MKNVTKHVSFRLSQMSLDLLKQIAEREGRSQSKQIEIMIREEFIKVAPHYIVIEERSEMIE